ncbi:MAG: hypothetical protein PUB13_08460, partial [Lachnospiraceae bacterium]|nr:hypothetical protein [Lachnospiraceae bacterium]
MKTVIDRKQEMLYGNNSFCYTVCITNSGGICFMMVIEIDFNSDEALYMQLRNQIILGIASSR